jgi:ABC-type histidine transport system ATPase subunit
VHLFVSGHEATIVLSKKGEIYIADREIIEKLRERSAMVMSKVFQHELACLAEHFPFLGDER